MPEVATSAPIPGISAAYIKRRHPYYTRWEEDERRSRASYLATRRHLSPFLVPHRFEGLKRPQDLIRSQYGYGIGLNQSYLHEIFGHVRSAAKETEYKPLTDTEWGALESDVTGLGMSWNNFFEGQVLEWMLTSVGGVVIVDAPAARQRAAMPGESATGYVDPAAANPDGQEPVETKADEYRLGIRPYLRWVPMSKVMDVGRSARGFQWIRLLEEIDERTPEGDKNKITELTCLYELQADGTTKVTRKNDQGEIVGETYVLEPLVDLEGRPQLPLVHAKFGTHPDVEWLGSGLLMGLDDIIIDMFNVLSEVREAYRDAAFGLLVYKGGDDYNTLKEMLDKGSRMVALGAMEGASLDRLAVDSGEVQAGLNLLELGIRAWALAAKRKAAEATTEARSGVSLQAEFQLDLKPLLVAVAETLDEVETNALYLLAQMYGKTPEQAQKVLCKRNTEFKLEEEASRISRIVGDFLKTLPLPGEAIRQIVMRWVESSGLVDLDEPITTAADATAPLGTPKRKARELIEQQVTAIADNKQSSEETPPQPFGGFGG